MMIRVLVIETTQFGYDGITNVITNYYAYMNCNEVHMDFVTINPISEKFKILLETNGSQNYVLSYRNNNPFKYVINLAKTIKEGAYSIVHVHGCSATMAVEMLAAKIAGVEIRIAHSHNTKCDHFKVDRFLRPFFSRWCNYGFACGQEAGEWMFRGKDFEIISNGIDLEKFQYNPLVREAFRSKYKLEDKFVIGHVGRFSEQKNHIKLLHIFEKFSIKHPEAYLVLIGDGELKDAIKQHAERQKLNVMFVGLSDEVEKWLQAMDLFVFPSLYEGLPLGLVEAQAAGLPCVLSDTISPMAKITDLVEFVRLDAASSEWITVMEGMMNRFKRVSQIDEIKTQIREKHFDINLNCKELVSIYKKLMIETRSK